MRLLSPVDQMFVRMETSRTPMHIGALAIFRLPAGAGPEFVRDIHAAFSELAYLPFPFDSVLSGGAVAEALPTWQRVEPDPEYHVRLSALPSPGDDADLGRLVERLHSHPLDMTARCGRPTSSRASPRIASRSTSRPITARWTAWVR